MSKKQTVIGEIGSVPAALYPSIEERLRADDALTRDLLAACQRVAVGPAIPRFDRARFTQELAAFDFERSRPLSDVTAWTIAQLEHGVVHMTHPRYFGLFNPAPTFPAQSADRIVGALNPQLASATTSPTAVEIESHVIRALGARAGLGAACGGHFTSGGSEANATSLLLALNQAHRDYALEGVRAFKGPPVFYVSRECHLAWVKIAQTVGLGRSAARMVATDGTGRMDGGVLARMLADDVARGAIPVMIAATAGTTGAGMIDPLDACADLAQRYGVWLHVDAAWAGALLASDRLKSALAGIERADSATIDAHKWFATTMGCGIILVKNRAMLAEAFEVSASFMPSRATQVDPYMTSLQWSRRFLGLRLFMSLATAGWAGHAAHVERAVALSGRLAQAMTARGWSVANGSLAAVVCLVAPEGSGRAKEIVARVLASGQAWISVAQFEGQDVIRACVTHGESTADDIDTLVEALETAREQA